MNREILFKAKRKDNGEWVEGFLFKQQLELDAWCIGTRAISANDFSEIYGEFSDWFKIDPDTICQYIGLDDKNDKKIWENDILHDGERLWQVHYYKNFAMYMLRGVKHNGGSNGMNDNFLECVVVGNIFDNAELLEVE